MNPTILAGALIISAACGNPQTGVGMPSATPRSTARDWMWIEAEDAARTNFPPPERNPFAPANPQEADVLSGGKWMGAPEQRTGTMFLEYEIESSDAGTYRLYARKFWQHGPFRFRIGDGPWTQVGETALMDEGPIRQFVVANWVFAGDAKLNKGKNVLRVELTTNQGAACFDAFLFTRGAFSARGKLKPGEKYNRAPDGWFAFEPDPDPFQEAALDLRFLNEKFAGENGPIVARGEDFVHSRTSKPIRFWAINTGAETMNLDRASVDAMARSLAKVGVNMVRIHGGVWGSDFRKADPKHVERIQYFVAAMKREGIYTCLSIYFPLWLRFDEKSGFAGYTGGKHPFSLLFFNKEFQDVYRGWWRDLLTPKNPHTGMSLAEDPAVAMVEMVNEDSHFFWTFTPYENIPGPQMEILEKQFGAWLAGRYGSLQTALKSWDPRAYRGDEPANGRVGFMPLWEIFSTKNLRAQDTATFLANNMRQFYRDTQTFLKSTLGYKGLTQASNWITADARVLGPMDKWSNAVADFMDRHGYWGPKHEGERASYSISVGDRYEDGSALKFGSGFSLPIWDVRYDNKPSAISEINWPSPNRFRADLPLLSAAYGLLQGSDAYAFFATGKPGWEETIGKFAIRTPVTMGQFPATALIFRNGLIKPGPVVAEANLRTSAVMALEGAPVTQPQNLDELRQKDVPPGQTASLDALPGIDPLAFAVGKVAINFVPNLAKSRLADITRFIDRDAKTVASATGELKWNWNTGVVTVHAPAAQGFTGFLSAAGTFSTPDVEVSSPMEYGTVLLVAMDGQPLRSSRKILLQVMSEEQQYGWQADGEGLRTIRNVGVPPIVVRNFAGTVSLKRPDASALKVTPLDANGYRLPSSKGAAAIRLKPNVLYTLIEK